MNSLTISNEPRARKQPRAIAWAYGFELVWGLLLASPAYVWVNNTWGAHPQGDDGLFQPGGHALLAMLSRDSASAGLAVSMTGLLFVVGVFLMQIPHGALLASLAFYTDRNDANDANPANEMASARPLRLREAMSLSFATFLPLAGALIVGSVAMGVLLGLGIFASGALETAPFAVRLGDARAFTLRVAAFVPFVLFASFTAVVVDLARVAIVRDAGTRAAGSRALASRWPAWSALVRGVRVALKTAKRAPRAAWIAWFLRFFSGVALIGIGALAAHIWPNRAGLGLAALFAVHQSIVFGRVALRASWLACALRGVASVHNAYLQNALKKAENESQVPSP